MALAHFRNNLETRKINFFFTFNFVTCIDWKQANWKQTEAHYMDSCDFSAFNNKQKQKPKGTNTPPTSLPMYPIYSPNSPANPSQNTQPRGWSQ